MASADSLDRSKGEPGPPPGLPAGERRQLTVMFCDLADSTGHWSRVDPEEFLELVRRYQALCRECVHRFGGHVAQYLGDGVMVYFGYPEAHEDDAVRALHAGLAILEALAALNHAGASSGAPQLSVRIGVHTGPVVTGRLGTPERGETLALGSTPNLAARLQALAAEGSILISEATQRLVRARFEIEELGVHEIKGWSTPEPLYRVHGASETHWRPLGMRGGRLSPLCGRQADAEVLTRAWAAAREGEARALLVSGEAGVGKSRLCAFLQGEVEPGAEPPALFEWRSSPYHSNAALYPVIDAFTRALGLGDLTDAAERLGRIEALLTRHGLGYASALALMAELLGVAHDLPPLAMTPERRKIATMEVVAQIYAALAAQAPTLLVVEDLHWADPTTFDLLRKVIETVKGRFLLLMTTRPGGWPFGDEVALERHQLGRIDDLAVRRLVAAVAGGKALPPAVEARIVDATDGVPLFIEEITQAVLESGQLTVEHERFGLRGDSVDVAIPLSLRDSLTARLDRLGSARATAHFAAVIGRRFSLPLLETIVVPDLEPAAVRADLDALVAAGLVYPLPEATGLYEFKHALVQLGAYETLLVRSRHEIHARVAAALTARRAAGEAVGPELLAHHHTAAQDWPRAVQFWLEAGLASLRSSANREAIAHVRAGQAALKHLPAGEGRDSAELALLSCLGPALIATAGFASDEVGQVYARARALSLALEGRAEFFPALWGSWVFHLVRGDLTLARSIAEQMLALGEKTGDDAMLVEAHWTLGDALYWLGDLAGADHHLGRSAQIYRAERHHKNAFLYSQDPGVAARCYWFLALFMRGEIKKASAVVDEARALADQLAHPFTTGWALVFGFLRSLFHGDVAGVRELAGRAVEYCTEQPVWLAAGVVGSGWARAESGDRSGGIARMFEGLALYEATGSGTAQPLWCWLLAEQLLAADRRADAAAIVARGLGKARETGERISEIELVRLEGELARADDPATAERRFREALATADALGARVPGLRVATALCRLLPGQPEPLRTLATRLAAFDADDDVPALREARALLQPP